MNGLLILINDWLTSQAIADMDATEERGFLRLCLHAAKREDEGFPKDERLLSHLSLLGAQWSRQTKDKRFRSSLTSGEKLLKCFDERDGRLFIPEVLESVRAYRERSQQASRAAKKRWGTREPATDALALQPHSARTGGSIVFDLEPYKRNITKIYNNANLSDSASDLQVSFEALVLEYPASGRERLQRAFEAFVSVIEHECAVRSCPPSEVITQIHAGLERWETSARWQRQMVHNIRNFLIERLWEEHPVQSDPENEAQRKKPSYADARASGEVDSLEEYEEKYGS